MRVVVLCVYVFLKNLNEVITHTEMGANHKWTTVQEFSETEHTYITRSSTRTGRSPPRPPHRPHLNTLLLTSLPLLRPCPLPGISFAFLHHLLRAYSSPKVSPPRRHPPPTHLIHQKGCSPPGLPEGIWSFFSSDINHFPVLGCLFFATVLAFSLAMEPIGARGSMDFPSGAWDPQERSTE